MTLTDQQKRALNELAHMRVSPEDAWMDTKRLAVLVDGNWWTYDGARSMLNRLHARGLVEKQVLADRTMWRITNQGREAIQ